MDSNWSFTSVWNGALDALPKRELVARDYIYASELGRGFYDRYHKMHGRQPETPPNKRALRKFEAGNLTEWVVEQILIRAGVLQAAQQRIMYEDGPMTVSGRCDFIGGGSVRDIDQSFYDGLPENFVAIANVAIDRLKEIYPNGMSKQGIELKSCSAMMYERYERAPAVHHALQAYHYARQMNIPYVLEYISRDDLRMTSWTIYPTSAKWEKLYQNDINQMAHIYGKDDSWIDQHIKEPLLTYNKKTGKFGKNFEIEYSSYLTDYGFETPEDYGKPAQSYALRLSNIIKRIREGKEMSKVNQKTIEEGCNWFPAARTIIDKELGDVKN